ncbi:hypothetical protein ES288_A07G055300v1 [Gossypium darwinii]|uniref:Uncharacterized protein n=1 Tax=Gossypium darwinii TaxID=34276 RepID=A0A5D2FTY2_GOSDA|nr:hypothetical protein ES288_A07G055300v1 [Gossypium darwinii]
MFREPSPFDPFPLILWQNQELRLASIDVSLILILQQQTDRQHHSNIFILSKMIKYLSFHSYLLVMLKNFGSQKSKIATSHDFLFCLKDQTVTKMKKHAIYLLKNLSRFDSFRCSCRWIVVIKFCYLFFCYGLLAALFRLKCCCFYRFFFV